ncbi:uncharacterized protein LOC106408901 [Brassica napus]|uniref:uncharacterized protein LOC106408901 n=1 Tax=Brassica napus TaxID=3708 RepID=UPI0006AAA460|nr:uncharacterized protein LOC106408901 [Brassica napus]
MSLVREEIGIGEHTPVVLSYQLPPNILLPYGSKSAPTNVLTGEDVELMMSVQEWTNDVQLCVTFGATNVAKYQFLCKEPFTIDGTTFFSDGVTEEEHIAAILDMAGDDEIDVSGPGHGEIFSEKNLVLVYRLALEIEKARSMFGTNMSRSNDLGDDGRDVNQNTKPPETEEPQESPSEQDFCDVEWKVETRCRCERRRTIPYSLNQTITEKESSLCLCLLEVWMLPTQQCCKTTAKECSTHVRFTNNLIIEG